MLDAVETIYASSQNGCSDDRCVFRLIARRLQLVETERKLFQTWTGSCSHIRANQSGLFYELMFQSSHVSLRTFLIRKLQQISMSYTRSPNSSTSNQNSNPNCTCER